MALQSYKQLIVWQRSIDLVSEVYKLTDQLPSSETYALVSQMRKASVSIPSNIAEGYKRKNRGEYLQFLGIADASAAELETQLIIIQKLYPNLDPTPCLGMLNEIQKMSYRLIRQLTPAHK